LGLLAKRTRQKRKSDCRNDNRRNRHVCNEYIDIRPFDRFDNHLAHIFCRKNIWHKTAIQSESYRNGEIEKRVLSFDRTKQTVTGIDTTKLSVYEHEKAFLFPHFDAIPQMPGTLLDFRPDYTRSFPVDRSSLHKGEYNVGGIIHRFNKVDVWGRGRQENIIGVGVSNYAEVKSPSRSVLYGQRKVHVFPARMILSKQTTAA